MFIELINLRNTDQGLTLTLLEHGLTAEEKAKIHQLREEVQKLAHQIQTRRKKEAQERELELKKQQKNTHR